ncbi:MAG TPA: hypothetical protein VNU66_01375 [Mycobacteriales bacterium]|nr:hypothetical protein [Mycobacteriales bacterium]
MSRLVTTVRLAGGPGVSVSFLHELERDDGTRVLLLDDRGCTSSGTWKHVTRGELERDARTCVGPDEPPPGRTHEEEERLHWEALGARVGVPGPELAALRHDVVLDPQVEALVAQPGLAPRPLDPEYLRVLLRQLARYLAEEQSDPAATVHLAAREDGLVVVMRAGGRVLEAGLADRLCAYVPDGHDPRSHAEWLAQTFDEDADPESGRAPAG